RATAPVASLFSSSVPISLTVSAGQRCDELPQQPNRSDCSWPAQYPCFSNQSAICLRVFCLVECIMEASSNNLRGTLNRSSNRSKRLYIHDDYQSSGNPAAT